MAWHKISGALKQTVRFRDTSEKAWQQSHGPKNLIPPLIFAFLALVPIAVHAQPRLDAAVELANGTACFFKGDKVAVYDLSREHVSGSFRPLCEVFPGLPKAWCQDGIDAAMLGHGGGRIHFFKGSEFVPFNLEHRELEGPPRPIVDEWEGVFPDGIDDAVNANNGKAYFFKGSRYIRFDFVSNRADKGYPKNIAGEWHGFPGDWSAGIDAAFSRLNGNVYFFRGTDYIRYHIGNDKADPGYPKVIDDTTWGGLRPLLSYTAMSSVPSASTDKSRCLPGAQLALDEHEIMSCDPSKSFKVGSDFLVKEGKKDPDGLDPRASGYKGFARRIEDGAIYDLNGNIVCILKKDTGAFVVDMPKFVSSLLSSLPENLSRERQCSLLEEAIVAADNKSSGLPPGVQRVGPDPGVKGNLSNHDLLTRVVLIHAEGGCNEVMVKCVPDYSSCSSVPPGAEFGSRYYAYTLKFARRGDGTSAKRGYDTDDAMLKVIVRDIVSKYEVYFVQPFNGGNTQPMFDVVKEPSTWMPNPPLSSPCSTTASDEDRKCNARARVSRCIADVIAAELDEKDASSPFNKPPPATPYKPDGWRGASDVRFKGGKPYSEGYGEKGLCGMGWQRIVTKTYMRTPLLNCFKEN